MVEVHAVDEQREQLLLNQGGVVGEQKLELEAREFDARVAL
jgi:hypothetical protein